MSGIVVELELTTEQYEQLTAITRTRQLAVDDAARVALTEWLEREAPRLSSMPSAFAAEVAAFEQMKPALMEQYGGQAVAVHGGQVIVAGSDKMAVLADVVKTYGPVPCYIEWVEPASPRRARIPSAWVKR